MYKVLLKYSDGTTDLYDDEFETEEEAEDYGLYLIGCSREGAEILNMSNPGDYPLDDNEDLDFEIVEFDE